MKPVKFTGCNANIGEGQAEYATMPAMRFPGNQGIILCCWKLTWRERLTVLWRGLVWHQVMTFGQPLQPQLLTTERP